MERKKVTISYLMKKKREGTKITKVNVFDYPMAVLCDQVGIDILMIGDSVGMVVLGYESTIPVTMEDMIHHAKAVSRGTEYAFVICDMPFLSYQISTEGALRNAGRLVKETGVDAVKLEGGKEIKDTVASIVRAGIPVVGHIGLTPQRSLIGGYRRQGRDAITGRMILEDAIALEQAGVSILVLENTTSEVAKKVTDAAKIPVIAAGSGPYCDGQSLNIYDILGLSLKGVPKFAKRYFDGKEMVLNAVAAFKKEVEGGVFPDKEHTFHMDDGEAEKLIAPSSNG
jgi:3-methyl-2-oxobutanoate hydroxymethyltransferase